MGTRDILAVCVSNRIAVPSGDEEEFEDQISGHLHLVNQAQGFLRHEVHRPIAFNHTTTENRDQSTRQGFYQVKTWWRSLKDFEAWVQTDAYTRSNNTLAGQSHQEIHQVVLSSDLVEKPMTLDSLAQYRGVEGQNDRIFVGLCGKVFDVTSSAGFYGPSGAYHVFAGRDASRGLAKGFLEEYLVMDRPGDVADLSAQEQMKLEQWLERFENKYPCVGVLAGTSSEKEDIVKAKKQPRVYKKKVVIRPSSKL